ncbi:MAG TPA: AraC family transcriptional regulator [Clostridiales bacterium]|nr:AraC family transcriptional regulator [Clostridiales bacterium]
MERYQVHPFHPRQQMRGEDYEIFHYRDTQSRQVPVHHHDFYEVYLFLEGNVEFVVEGHCYTPRPGDLMLINPTELHQLRSRSPQEPYERMVLWIAPEHLEGCSTPQTNLLRCFDNSWEHHSNLIRWDKTQENRALSLFHTLLRERSGQGYGGDVAAQGIWLQLMVEINRLSAVNQTSRELEDRGVQKIRQILEYIDRNYNKKLSLDQLAGEFFISKYYLSHEFQRLVGASVYRYIIQRRLIVARQMLSAGISPTEVNQNCGFGDYSNFYRAFKEEYGISPSDFAGLQRGRTQNST